MSLNKKQTPLLKQNKDIQSLDLCFPFLCLRPGEVHLFSARGTRTLSEGRGQKNTGYASMNLRIPMFPEPPHALGMLDKAHLTIPPTHRRCLRAPHPSQHIQHCSQLAAHLPALLRAGIFPSHSYCCSFTNSMMVLI